MKVLKPSDYKMFVRMCGLTQKGLKHTMSKFLRTKYKKVTETEDYIIAEGTIPIALVCHLDTVFEKPAKDVYYDRCKNVIWSPQGLGADDRAGAFAIVQIIRSGLRPHIILTTDEEVGAKGAFALGRIDMPFADMRYMIELDRHGANDCVFYDCANITFTNYIESFGFVEAIGTFSDISILSEYWGIAGVNLSIGYRNEHSYTETLFVGDMLHTIERVIEILTVKEYPEQFKFVMAPWATSGKGFFWEDWYNASKDEDTKCHICGKKFKSTELIPIIADNNDIHNYCIDCVVDHVAWCTRCGEGYEVDNIKENVGGLCLDCRRTLKY